MSVQEFKGRGGGLFGGDSAAAATDTPDTLRSKDTIEFVLGISEGPINGLVRGAKDFLVGDTPLVNSNGDSNFGGFTLEELSGNPGESIALTLGGETSSTTVSTQLAKDTAVTRQGTHANIDFIDIRLVFQQLFSTDDAGSTFWSAGKILIELKPSSSPDYVNPLGGQLIVNGKTTSPYVKEIRIPVAHSNDFYDIRVTNQYDFEDTDTHNHCVVAWESFQEVLNIPLQLHDVAAVHCLGEATNQFSSIPEFSGIYQGRIVRIPTNYNPITRVNTGIWDGTFVMAYTNNPVWCVYDFVNNDRYGINKYYPMVMDKWDAYEASLWCDEQVPDGSGGTQPRYTYNDLIQDPRNGREMARYMAGVFNGAFFDDGNGTAHLKVDKDDPAVALYTPENVEGGKFEYSFTEIDSRYNDITVSFTNPDLAWDTDRRRVEIDAEIAKNGRIPLDFIAVGCTNVIEAVRRARYKAITATTEVTTVTFRTNRLGAYNKPFEVILIADDQVGFGLHGRIKTVSSARVVTLRDAIYLEVGIVYTVTFQLSDGAGGYTMVTRTIDAASPRGSITTFTVTADLPTLPDRCVFSLSSGGASGVPKPFRLMRRSEVDGDSEMIEMVAMEVNRDKWAYADAAVSLAPINYTSININAPIPGPTSVTFAEDADGNVLITPSFPSFTYKWFNQEFDVWTQTDLNGWEKSTVTNGNVVAGLPVGLREFAILPRNIFGAVAPLNGVQTFFYSVGGQNVYMLDHVPETVVSTDLVVDQNLHVLPSSLVSTLAFGSFVLTGGAATDDGDGLGEGGIGEGGLGGP